MAVTTRRCNFGSILVTGLMVFLAGLLGPPLGHATAAEGPVEAPRPADWEHLRPPVQAVIPLPPVSEVIAALDSPRYHRREEATRLLRRYGPEAIGAIKEAAISGRAEVSIRSLNALEAITLDAIGQGESALAEAGLLALDELARSENARLSRRVTALLTAHSSEIFDYSLAQVRRYHAEVHLRPRIGSTLPDGGRRPVVSHIIIGRNWSGGMAGLVHVRHLEPQEGVYFIRGGPLPGNIEDIFESRAPNLRAAERGPSRLGVSSSTPRNARGSVPCRIDLVAEGSAADEAGILPGDVVVKFNKEEIESFQDLVKAIGTIEPGTSVPATVRRGEELVELEVTLQGWTEAATGAR